MMKKAFACLAVLLVAGATVVAADVDLEGVKCVVADESAKEDKSANYRDAKVYFCCGKCVKKFAVSPKKYFAKANHQLVATKQFKQKACPFTGRDLNPDTAVKVAGVEVAFCCNKCKGKVESKEDDAAKAKLIFANKMFEKGFEKAGDEG